MFLRGPALLCNSKKILWCEYKDFQQPYVTVPKSIILRVALPQNENEITNYLTDLEESGM